MLILGVHGGPRGTHEAGVCLLDNGRVIYALHEERYNRFKNAVSCFPHYSLLALFKRTGISPKEIDLVTFAGATYEDMHIRWPMYVKHTFGITTDKIRPVHHQVAHLASAYYYTNSERALVISLDGVGDRSSGIVAYGEGATLTSKLELSVQQSFGFFWSLCTQYIGYDPLEEAYKTMGLAPLGTPRFNLSPLFNYENGAIQLNSRYLQDKWKFISKHPLEPMYSEELREFFSEPPRTILEPLREFDKDVAASAQHHIEKTMQRFVAYWLSECKVRDLFFAGGVALNSHMSGFLSQTLPLDRFFVTPCPSDGGLALGAALYTYAQETGKRPEPIDTPYLGFDYTEAEMLAQLEYAQLPYKKRSLHEIAGLLKDNKVMGLYQGRAEFGPRALGNRSIIASPLRPEMKDIVNKKIKFREEYRPFAPVVLNEDYHNYFEATTGCCDYMSFAVKAKPSSVSRIPAVVHFDGTSRVQTITRAQNTFYYGLLSEFKKLTGESVLLNTSFNLKGEPIVETPADALRTFIASGLDYLILGPYVVAKPNMSNC